MASVPIHRVASLNAHRTASGAVRTLTVHVVRVPIEVALVDALVRTRSIGTNATEAIVAIFGLAEGLPDNGRRKFEKHRPAEKSKQDRMSVSHTQNRMLELRHCITRRRKRASSAGLLLNEREREGCCQPER